MKSVIFFSWLILLIPVSVFSITFSNDYIGHSIRHNNYTAKFYPYFSYSLISTTSNKLWGQVEGVDNLEDGIDAGVLFQLSNSKFINVNGFLKYEPGFDDDCEFCFESLFTDLFYDASDVKFGVVFGNIAYSYGFYGITRSHPGMRQSVFPPLNIIWVHNRVLYDTGFGRGVYLRGTIGDLSYSIEHNELVHNRPKPTDEYNRGLSGSEVVKTDIKASHFELNWNNNEFRLDRLKPTHHISMTDAFWTNNYPFVPGPYRLIDDDLTQLFDLYYIGFRQFYDTFYYSLEVVRWEHTGLGTLNKFFEIMGVDPYKGVNYYFQILFNYRITNTIQGHVNYGFTEGEKVHPDDETDTGNELCGGLNYDYTPKDLFKFQICNINDLRYVPYHENPDSTKIKKRWMLAAVQYVSLF